MRPDAGTTPRSGSDWKGTASLVALVIVPLVVLVTVLVGVAGNRHAASASRAEASPTGPVAPDEDPTPTMAVYAGSGSVSGADAFEASLGAPVPEVLDYLDGSSWASIASPTWVLDQWRGSGFGLMLGVPMLAPGSTLAAGATGAYDAEFATLAQNLVSSGFGDARLLIGFDPTVSGSAWSVSTPDQAAEYVVYWRRIVEAMRAVPGASFHFVWDVTPPGNGLTPEQLYPGNSYVDEVATDIFDIAPGAPSAERFSTLAAAPFGPDWMSEFAEAMGKPFDLAKWGVVPVEPWGGGGDDPDFVRALLAWARQDGVSLLVTWDDGDWAISDGAFPESMAALRASAGPSPPARP